MKEVCDFIARWMGVIVLLVAALSLIVPASFLWIDTKTINPLLGVIMFGMGLTLSPHDFRIVLSHPKDILIGCLAQFTIMPLLAFGLAWAFSLPSVGMTATSTLLAPVLTPLLVWLMAGTMVDVDTMGMLLSIVYVVIAPIICGLLCQRFLPRITKCVVPYLPALSSIAIAMVVGIVVSHNADRLLVGGLMVVVVVMAHNLLGLLIGYILGRLLRLTRPKCVALSIEVGMQNSGLASSLAVLHFAAFPFATIPGAVFSVWHNISGAMAAKLYQSNSLKNK